jgi:hypothetical protein
MKHLVSDWSIQFDRSVSSSQLTRSMLHNAWYGNFDLELGSWHLLRGYGGSSSSSVGGLLRMLLLPAHTHWKGLYWPLHSSQKQVSLSVF